MKLMNIETFRDEFIYCNYVQEIQNIAFDPIWSLLKGICGFEY